MIFTHPIDEHRFREATERRSVTKGCKRLSIGRICAACNVARTARKAGRGQA